jgi:DNA polymerase-3 subunit beta
MTFFSLNQKDFLHKLNICNQISPKKSDIELFTFTKIEVADGELMMSCLNSNLYFKSSLKVQNLDAQENIVFLIKTDLIASSVGLIVDENVGIEVNFEKNSLIVQGSKSKYTLRIDTQNLSDFNLPKSNPENLVSSVRIISNDLMESLKTCQVSVGQPKNVYQPEFLNICFTLKPTENKLLIVSTDRYRITKNVNVANFDKVSPELTEQEQLNFLVNPRSLQLITSVADNKESTELNFEKDFLWVNFEKSTVIMRYGEGKYPDYDKIIPQSFTCSFVVPCKDLLTSLKQVYLFARTNTINRSITLKVDPKSSKIVFSAQTQDGYSSESSVDIEGYEGVQDEWTQAFNADYLIDYISAINDTKILWESNPGKPSVLSPENKKERQLYLVSGLK